MMKKLVIAFGALALVTASAATRYKVEFSQPADIGGQSVKKGEYTLEVKGNMAILKGDNGKVEAEAKVETQDKKYVNTAVRYNGSESRQAIEEIRIGGTNTKLVFAKPGASGND